jgi:hypothetical protein
MGGNSAWYAHLGGFVIGAIIHPWFIQKNVHYQIDVQARE